MSGGWQGVCGCQCSEGVCPRALCSLCCFSPQLCICPQVSSCLSACYDVLAALVRCLSQRLFISTSLPSCIHLHLWMCQGDSQNPCPLTLTALPQSWTPPFLSGPCCWALCYHSDGCQVPEADSQRWGCRLHPRGRLRGASHCVEKGMFPRQPTPTKGQGPALPSPSSLPTLGSFSVDSEEKRKFHTAQYLVSQFSVPLLSYLYFRGPRHLAEMGRGFCEQRGGGPLDLQADGRQWEGTLSQGRAARAEVVTPDDSPQ